MVKKIDISDLNAEIDDNSFLVCGSPFSVGFSTIISRRIAHNIFFKDNFTALILCSDRKSKIDLSWLIQKEFSYFEYPLKHDIDGINHYLYIETKNGGGACITNYDEFTFNTLMNLDEKYDIIVVDRDDCSDYLYENLDLLDLISEKLVINTYDVPHSIFYHLDCPKIVLKSKYADSYIMKNYFNNNKINYHNKLLGEFKSF